MNSLTGFIFIRLNEAEHVEPQSQGVLVVILLSTADILALFSFGAKTQTPGISLHANVFK